MVAKINQKTVIVLRVSSLIFFKLNGTEIQIIIEICSTRGLTSTKSHHVMQTHSGSSCKKSVKGKVFFTVETT